jgi:hypothetical protein
LVAANCDAAALCRLCGKPIGFDRPFYGEGPTAVHCDCAEREYRAALVGKPLAEVCRGKVEDEHAD